MISQLVSRLIIVVFGTLYPAYASFKAVRTKNVKEYVKWMMYWIVFALFTTVETFTDVFISFWFPFYYEFKIILVLWLLSPATKGSSILYRKFVHPMLTRREQEIDEYIARAREQGYHTVMHIGTKGMQYATNVLVQTAVKSFPAAQALLPSGPSEPDIGIRARAISEPGYGNVTTPDDIQRPQSVSDLNCNGLSDMYSEDEDYDDVVLMNREPVVKAKVVKTDKKRGRRNVKKSGESTKKLE